METVVNKNQLSSSRSLKTIGAYVVEVGSAELDPASDLETHQIDVKPFNRRTAKKVFKDIFTEAERMAGEILDFKRKRQPFGPRVFRASWGKVDSEAIKAAGPSAEFAGPTDRRKGSHMLPGFVPDHVTNISNTHLYTDKPVGEVDALADVRHLPFADGSLGSVHISCLNQSEGNIYDQGAPLRTKALKESARVLKNGGYLVWDAGTKQDFEVIAALGLQPVALAFEASVSRGESRQYDSPRMWVSGIYQKPITDSLMPAPVQTPNLI